MITIITAAEGARSRRRSLFKQILKLSPGRDFSPILLLVPNSFTATLIKREFFHYLNEPGECRAYIPFETLTIQQIASAVSRLYIRKKTVSDNAVTLVLDSLTGDAGIGFAAHLADLNKKLRHFLPGSAPEEVMKDACKMIFDEKTSSRVELAFRHIIECRRIMQQAGASDPAKTISEAIPILNKYLNGRIIFTEGFIDPTPLEQEFIAASAAASSRAFISASGNSVLLRFLTGRFPDAEREHLPGSARKHAPAYYEFSSPEDEVEGIAEFIKTALINGEKPWDITVTFPAFSYYLPTASRVFRREGIPVNIPVQPLGFEPRAVLADNVLSCLEEDYPRVSMLSVLTSPYLRLIPAELKERAVSLAYRAGIIAGKESWLSVKETLLNLPGNSPDDTPDKLYEKFSSALKKIIEGMEAVRLEKSAGGFAAALERWLQGAGFFDQAEEEQPDSSRSAGLIRDCLKELAWAAGTVESSSREDERAPARHFRYLLSDASARSEDPDGINLIPYELAAVAEPALLITGGMTEEALPSRPKIDPLIPEKVKRALGLPDLEYYLRRQRRYFGRLMNESGLEPVFTCPAAEGDKIFLPSPFIDWNNAMRPPESAAAGPIAGAGTAEETLLWRPVDLRSKSAAAAFSGRLKSLTGRGLSVTDLDYFRKCPMRFYVEKILDVEAEQPPRFEVQARLWGSIAHRTMELLYRDGEVPVDALGESIMRCLYQGLQDFPVWRFWQEVAVSIFRRLIPLIKEQELQVRGKGYMPFKAEERLSGRIGSWLIKGKIDRADISKEGTGIMLIDYKTGSSDSRSLQLPLYALLWQQNNDSPVDAAGFYSLKDGRISWQPKRDSDIETFIDDAAAAAENFIREISSGLFPSRPAQSGECTFCGHGPLCGRGGHGDE